MKKIITVLLTLAASAAMSFASLAMEQLPAPSWVKWDSSDGLKATCETIEAAEGEYRVEVYKDGELFDTMGHRGYTKAEFAKYRLIEESGAYTFRVQARGDGMENTDSEWSEFSEPYVYIKPNLAFGAVRNPHWSTTQTGVIEWNPPADIPGEYADDLEYAIELYADGKRKWTLWGRTGTSEDVRDKITESAEYTFSVRADSRNIEKITHGPWVMGDTFIDVENEAEEVLSNLQDLHLQMDDLASPSDAEEALEKMDINQMAIAAQSNEDVLRAMSDVEERYLEMTGKSVEKVIDEDVNLNSEDIDLIGTGLNIASDSNAIEVNFGKPDKEAEVDDQLYKNVVQFDIGLTNSIKKLRAPVTIIMPIPQNIKPERLMILHYHKDGTYETIWPVLTDDGRAQFTVTRFSIFAFAEKVEPEDPDGPDDPGNTDEPDDPEDPDTPNISDDRHSYSGGGSGYHSKSGMWKQSGQGWWYQNGDGSWPVNQWKQLIWDGKTNWYFFDQNGYMKTGWLDWNGKRYYLHPLSDGNMGYMYSGQKMIDGNWYFFDPDGALVTEGETPDESHTDAN